VSISNLFAIVPAQVVRRSFDMIIEKIEQYQASKSGILQTQILEEFTHQILIYGMLLLGMAILRGLFMFFMRQTIIVMSRLIEYDQKNEIYSHLQTLPLTFYRFNNTGDLMARISEDVSKVRMYFGPAVMYGLNLITMSILCIVIMLNINVKLTLFALIPFPILSLLIYIVNNKIEKHSSAIQQQLSNISTFIQEAFSGIRVIKSFARENDSISKFETENELYKQKQIKLLYVNSAFTPIVMVLVGLSVIIVVYVGGLELKAGRLTIGNIAEFIMYVTMLTWPFTSLGWISSITKRAEASQKRINELLAQKTDLVSVDSLKKCINGKIEFRNVSLIYPDSGIKALQNISFVLEKGHSLAIFGNTGSGKTTLANLICRLIDPTEGEILIDDKPIKSYDIESLRSQIGYVPQDVFLFSDTISNNIGFGLDKYDYNQIIEYADKADLTQNINSFPLKYDTILGERGINLSGGQKQRVSIARALITKPQIIILDDCLSAVDTHTENIILKNLENEMLGKTSIIISHRISSAKLADHIIVLEEGRIIEQGTQDELMSGNTKFRQLFELQSRD
jgi:ATP-binding cassette subfamily B protein